VSEIHCRNDAESQGQRDWPTVCCLKFQTAVCTNSEPHWREDCNLCSFFNGSVSSSCDIESNNRIISE
jgi:hypothetical protein